LATAILALTSTASGQVKVLTSAGFLTPFRELLPEIEKSTGITVTTTIGQSQGTGPNVIAAQLRRGVPADVVIMAREGLDELIAQGRIATGTATNLAQAPLGVSVREGAPKPDISTVEAFKNRLLAAKSITFPGSTTGIYMTTKLFPKLGIAEQISSKITNVGVAAVARGEAEIAIQPVSELLHVPGVAFVGTIPKEIQYISVFSAAIVEGSKEPAASKRLIGFLTSEGAQATIRNSGMEPAAHSDPH
jgi:molybdate transport system substrate-binding protein